MEEKSMVKKVLGDRLIILPIKDADKTKGGIILAEESRNELFEGVVLQIGTGIRDKDGNLIPSQLEVGDHVVYGKFAPQEVEIRGKKFVTMREQDIFFVLDEAQDMQDTHEIVDDELRRKHHAVKTEVSTSTLLNDVSKKEFLSLTSSNPFEREL